jgi:hypothetical protein
MMQTIQQISTWFSSQKLGGKLAIGCSGLFALFCWCAFSIAILNPSPSNAEAEPTSADISSIQTSAFETAVAGVYQTATASVPTITPTSNIPTLTSSPIPTQTSEATVTPDVDLYMISMGAKFPAYEDAFLTVYAYNQEVANDTSLLFDTDWKTKQGLALGLLNLRADDLSDLQPSPKYAALHSIITELVAETHLFTDAYAMGVDNLDADLMYKAIEHLQNMNQLMEQGTTELERLQANP